MSSYDSIDEALNTQSDIIKADYSLEIEVVAKHDEVKKDYEYTRASPRAYEVAGQLLKSVADSTDKLMDLQKKVREVDEEVNKTTNNVTNNAVFVGSTSDLSKMLKQGFLDKKD